MFETHLTVMGTAVTTPWRLRSERTGAAGAKLRLMSTSRRYDKAKGQWVDGDRLFVEVVCWRDLAEHVCASVFKGDPLVVTGRLYTRDFEVDGRRRWAYEIDATSVGHDMSRGTSHFNRPEPGTWLAEVVDPVGGEETPAGVVASVRPGDAGTDERRHPERAVDRTAASAADPLAVSIVDSTDGAGQAAMPPPAAFAA